MEKFVLFLVIALSLFDGLKKLRFVNPPSKFKSLNILAFYSSSIEDIVKFISSDFFISLELFLLILYIYVN